MSLIQLVYASRPFGFEDSTLNSILSKARYNNKRDAITGALVCREDIYLQYLEGPEAMVDAAFARILRDDRHMDVMLKCRNQTAARLFPAWDMRDDPAKSWMWTPGQVRAGALEVADDEEVLAVFARVAAEAD